jgi:hypothetical protein
MVSQKKGNPNECDNLQEVTQRGLGETGNTPVFISHYFIALLRAVINVPQNHENTMPAFLGVWGAITSAPAHPKMGAFFWFFWWSL